MIRRIKKSIIVFFGAIALLIFFIFPFGRFATKAVLGKITQPFVFSFLYPLQRIAIEAGRLADGVASGVKYHKEADVLREELKKQAYDLAGLNQLKKENEELRQALSFIKDEVRPKTIATIFRSGTIFSNDFLINKGEKDGIKEGDFVVAPYGALIGKVTDVFERTANVLPVTDSRFKIAAFVDKNNQASDPQGIIEGSYGTALKLKFVPQADKIAVDDLVAVKLEITSRSVVFPVGKIKRIETSARDLFQEAVLSPLVDFFDFDEVMIYRGAD